MLPFIILVIAIGIGIHFYVQQRAAQLKNLPDVYSLPAISQEPKGDEVFITTTDGTRIRAVSKGTGPTVVLAHGFMITLMEWNVIWQLLLDAGYRVIAFDQRGHGKSTIGSEGMGSKQMAGDYKAVLEHFAVRDAILVGHSMGGFISLAYMLNYPESAQRHLRGVILFATLVGNVTRDAPQNRLQIPLIKSGIMKRVMQSDSYGFLFGASIMGDTPSPSAIKGMLPIMAAQNSAKLVPILEAMVTEDYSSRLGEIPFPAVVICGRLDNTTPVWQSETLGTKIPNARNVWVEGKGHLLNWEAPQALVEAVKSLT